MLLAGLAAVVALSFIAVLASKRVGPVILPEEVRHQLTFQPAVPKGRLVSSDAETYVFKPSSVHFDAKQGVLSYVVDTNSKPITVTQQAYPEILIFDKLVGPMAQYDEIQTKLGKVALTRPPAAGKQVAVMSTYNGSSGILLFAKSDNDLSKQQWQDFFTTLRVSNE